MKEHSGGPAPSILFRSAFAFACIGFLAWVTLSWSGYARRYVDGGHGWRIGATQLIEISLSQQDQEGLACASDVTVEGLQCGYTASGAPRGGDVGEVKTLRPYNTVKNEMFLGAGLWTSLASAKTPKNHRFTAFCNYEIVGAVKSASIRFAPGAAFGPLQQTLLVGSLSNCVVPQ